MESSGETGNRGVGWHSVTKKSTVSCCLLVPALNIYSAIIATIFVSHIPAIVTHLPNFIESSQPNLQLGLFLFQELSMFFGSYLRLIGAAFALNCILLFYRKDPTFLVKLRFAFLFESFYFLLLIPTAMNHLVGSVISTSAFLNIYTGLSALLQVMLIFPPLFMLSRKLKHIQNTALIMKWTSIAVPLYVLGFWVKAGFMWVYAISPVENSWGSLVEVVGSVNSWLTLLIGSVICGFVFLSFRQKKNINNINIKLVGAAAILTGGYFLIYDLVSVWDPIYRAFLSLTDFCLISLLVLGVAVLVDSRHTLLFNQFSVVEDGKDDQKNRPRDE